jgi:DnaK suppressor protein
MTAQYIAQSATSHQGLSQTQIDKLRALLLDERKELAAARAELDSVLTDESVPENAEVTSREESEALAAQHDEALGAIDVALSKMDEGTYGQCITCNSQIPYERLEAIPAATTCVACQAGKRTGALLR